MGQSLNPLFMSIKYTDIIPLQRCERSALRIQSEITVRICSLLLSCRFLYYLPCHLLHQIMKALIMLRLRDRAMFQKLIEQRFLPKEQFMVLFFVG